MLGEWYLPPGKCQAISTITEGIISISHPAPLSSQTRIPQTSSPLVDKSQATQAALLQIRRSEAPARVDRRAGGAGRPAGPRRLPSTNWPSSSVIRAIRQRPQAPARVNQRAGGAGRSAGPRRLPPRAGHDRARSGQPGRGARLLRESIAVLEQLGDRRDRTASLHQLAITEHDQGNPAEAPGSCASRSP